VYRTSQCDTNAHIDTGILDTNMHGTTCPKKVAKQGTTPGGCIIPTVSTHSWPSPSDSEKGLLIGTREKCNQESTLKNENEGVIRKDSVPELKIRKTKSYCICHK
jgi:hypothetical protein